MTCLQPHHYLMLLSSFTNQLPFHRTFIGRPNTNMSDAADTSIYGMFPHSALLATHATCMKPTYESLHQSMMQLNANAASNPSSNGDGLLGHLLLTLGQAAYSAISAGNVAYPPPAPPPPVPDIPSAGAAAPTAALLAEI
jgi:hypothetical protein